ncbi:TetR/AcrR family transcriptional regulator [Rhodococcus erythropolis]|uniref:TetR/AcrR family transcriptional regulator n=1 Tax=Rhodococcus erythropolis TaxID=1833 RepID=UPI001C9B4A67|nr:TetR/AcrR family transcriptional regulator [Rhodococcus erythropolis]MBY6388829.1 TetR/AcrR family transcriptional regulator [Rhodococcus erythropolis]
MTPGPADQGRPQETSQNILNAAAQLLDRDGYQALSTNQIAEQAHLSIGTIYRYFSDKDAIVVAVRARTEDDIMRRLVGALAQGLTLDAVAGARHLLSALVEALEDHRGVMAAVINDLPLGIQSNVLPTIEQQLYHIARLALLQHYPRLREPEVDEILYLGMGMMLQVALRIAIDRPPAMSKEALLDRAALLAASVNTILTPRSGDLPAQAIGATAPHWAPIPEPAPTNRL